MTKEKSVKIEIDGKKAEVAEGTTVLAAARKLGIHIPTLCHLDSVTQKASCRICVVEMSIEKRGRAYQWMDASCACPVEDGLVVHTDTPKVRRERKVILEMLLSRAPDSATLRRLAAEYGADPNRFRAADKGESKCILCGLCARVCDELIKVGCIGTSFRGIHKKIMTPYGFAQETCIGCGACAHVCPTGAIHLTEDNGTIAVDLFNTRIPAKTCSGCGRPFASVAQWERIRGQQGLRQDLMDRCPECRRKLTTVV